MQDFPHHYEQAELKSKIAPLKKEITKHNRHNCTTDEFLAVLLKYIHMKGLARKVLREFIDHLVVHHADNLKGERIKKIEIFYKCIGAFEAPKMNQLPHPPIQLNTKKGVAIATPPNEMLQIFECIGI